jgi:hypothetical protein
LRIADVQICECADVRMCGFLNSNFFTIIASQKKPATALIEHRSRQTVARFAFAHPHICKSAH